MPEAADAQTDIAKDVAKLAVVDLTLLPSGSTGQPGDLSEILPHSDIVKEASNANMPEAADAQTNITKDVVKLADEISEAYLDRIRRQYVADLRKQKDEMAEVLRNLTLETQQCDWEKQQKEKKEQRRLKTAKEKSKKEQNKKK